MILEFLEFWKKFSEVEIEIMLKFFLLYKNVWFTKEEIEIMLKFYHEKIYMLI